MWNTQLQTASGPHTPDVGLGSSVVCSRVWDVRGGGPRLPAPRGGLGLAGERRPWQCMGSDVAGDGSEQRGQSFRWLRAAALSSTLDRGESAGDPAGPGRLSAGPQGQVPSRAGMRVQTRLFGGSQGRGFGFGMLAAQSHGGPSLEVGAGRSGAGGGCLQPPAGRGSRKPVARPRVPWCLQQGTRASDTLRPGRVH